MNQAEAVYRKKWKEKNVAIGNCSHCKSKCAVTKTYQDDKLVDEKTLKQCWKCLCWERGNRKHMKSYSKRLATIDKLNSSKDSLELIKDRAISIKTRTQEPSSKLQSELIETESVKAIGVINS